MKLSPKEVEKLELHAAGKLAQERLARGVRLNCPEATALIASQILERIRDGFSVAELMQYGRRLLGLQQVMPGVGDMIHDVQVEGTFPDGTKLVTVHSPICREHGDFVLALAGSGLSAAEVPASGEDWVRRFPSKPVPGDGGADVADGVPPGGVMTLTGDIALNFARRTIELPVASACDRPIQVGSHYHFMETNRALSFDREAAFGMRLNIPSGTSVRFEPGEEKTVSLVDIAGLRVVRGGNGLIDGPVDEPETRAHAVERARERGFLREDYVGRFRECAQPGGTSLPRSTYAAMYGPTVGDRLRLGDTCLCVEVEQDFSSYGDECCFGGGKVLREGMGQATGVPPGEALDLVITNAVVIDWTGIYKADVGITGGVISGIGKAGNPDTMEGVTPGMAVGVSTEVVAGEGKVLTAGALDVHVHYICPQLAEEAVASGITTLLGGGTGPATGSCATTCTPAPEHLRMMLRATDALPLNFAFTGKGNSARPEGLQEIIRAGAVGLKLHEDWGTTPAAIDCCLTVAEEYDVQITIHTDTLNESGCVEDTVAAFKGRTIHTYHTEGAGGGHAPDIIKVCGDANVIPSSTNPTRPFTRNTIDEHLDMLMVCHHLNQDIPEDVAFAESRIRAETIAAEDRLHDIGALSIVASDSQAMGRIGEVISRTWQTADKMKRQFGHLKPEEADNGAAQVGAGEGEEAATSLGAAAEGAWKTPNDNFRVRRYVAKYTINPAIAHGMSHLVGSVEVGKVADLCLWDPAFFGAKPELVLKSGHIAWAQMGDANASIPTPQPVKMRPMFAGLNTAAASAASIAFVSQAAVEAGTVAEYGLRKRIEPVRNCRNIGKADMKLNSLEPNVTVDPETYRVEVDGVHLTCAPATEVPLAQRYFLF